MLDQEGIHNRTDFNLQIKRLAGTMPADPVETLLDVLSPLKGLKRDMGLALNPAKDRNRAIPLSRVANIVLVDSETRYKFRDALATYLNSHGLNSEQTFRTWLLRWSHNEALLQPYFAP